VEVMPPETPRDEESSDVRLVDVANSTNNDALDSQEMLVLPEDNEDADEETSLLRKRPNSAGDSNEITVSRGFEDIDPTNVKKKKTLFSIKNLLRLIILVLFILLIVVLLV
ncbi:14554_t:CDS:1, partial [Acaulospora morrowiae]